MPGGDTVEASTWLDLETSGIMNIEFRIKKTFNSLMANVLKNIYHVYFLYFLCKTWSETAKLFPISLQHK